MWVFHHTTKAPDLGFLGVGFKNLLSPRHPVRVGCGRLRLCEKSNMTQTINKMSSPRLPQASSTKFTQSYVVPGHLRPLVPDPSALVPGLLQPLAPLQNKNRLFWSGDPWGGRDLVGG